MCSQSIRPMPRARTQVVDILEQLSTVRANIASLNEVLSEKACFFPSAFCTSNSLVFSNLPIMCPHHLNRRLVQRRNGYKNCRKRLPN